MGDVPAPAITPGVLLSGVSLPSWPTGAMESLRSGRGPRVLVALHSAACLECRRYIQTELAPASEQLAQWGGRLAVVLPGFPDDARELAGLIPGAIQLLGDPDEGVALGSAMVIIVDEWGEVFFVANAGVGHDLPRSGDMAAWIRFLAIQCPECEGPEGDWRTV